MDPTNVREFLDQVSVLLPRGSEVIVYRGHEDRDFYLVPAVFRDGFEAKEHLLLSELISAHPLEFRDDTSALERLVRVQHYDLPSRLSCCRFHGHQVKMFLELEDEDGTTQVQPGVQDRGGEAGSGAWGIARNFVAA